MGMREGMETRVAEDNTAASGSAGGQIDSLTAAKVATRMALTAVVVGFFAGIATWLFLTIDHLGVTFLWDELPLMVPGVPANVVVVGVIVAMTAIAAVTVAISKGRPFDSGAAEAEYDEHGRMDYRRIPAGAVFALTSLFSGAAVGPEAALTDINGGLGTLIAERLRLNSDQIKILTYAGVAGAFGAFFGSAPVGALLAAELISPKSLSIDRTHIVPGLAAGATGYTMYLVLGGHAVAPILVVPGTEAPTFTTILLALALGVIGGVLGLVYGGVFVKTRLATAGLRKRPWLAGAAGAAGSIVAALTLPVLLFSGQTELPDIIAEAATIGLVMLLVLGVGKLVLSIWCLSTAYFGGPIFPLLFAGACFGLALNLAVPAIPAGVAVAAIATGMVTSAAVAPLSITIFIILISDPALAPAIAIAAVSAYIVRQAVAPTLPGVYRATRAAETAAAEPSS